MKANNNDHESGSKSPLKSSDNHDLKNHGEPVKKVDKEKKGEEIYPEVIKPTKKPKEQQKKSHHDAPDANEPEPD